MEEAAEEFSEASDNAVDAARELRDIADKYIERHDEALKKEAAVFGELFADACINRMQEKVAADALADSLVSIFNESHGMAMQKIAARKAAEEQAAIQAIYDDAFGMTMQKIADDLAVLRQLAAREAEASQEAQAVDQVMQEAAEAAQGAEPAALEESLEEPPSEPVAVSEEDRQSEAVVAAANAVKAVAEAAKALVKKEDAPGTPAGEAEAASTEEPDVEGSDAEESVGLEDIARNAYDAALAQIRAAQAGEHGMQA